MSAAASIAARRAARAAAPGAPAWEVEGHDWPNREHSRFISAGGLRWHVQIMGEGPPLLLVHGTGAATHSFRDFAPLLAKRFTVIAPDLPGHGFTERPASNRLSLPGMAAGLAALLETLGHRPEIAIGHSAGAAIVTRMTLDGMIVPKRLISLNGALLPFEGLPGHVFAPVARLLAMMPGVPWFFARHGSDHRTVERLLRDTGSRIDPRAVELYGRLVRCPGHVAGTLGMMANWELGSLQRDLSRLRAPLLLIAGAGDRTVRPADSRRVAALVPGADLIVLPGLGHLAHEEAPAAIAALIVSGKAA